MSEIKHTPEPWKQFAFEAYDANDILIADFGYSDDVWGKDVCQENALRSVECVNACAGMESPSEQIPQLKSLLQKWVELQNKCYNKETAVCLAVESAELLESINVKVN